jgi:hypothetical protein
VFLNPYILLGVKRLDMKVTLYLYNIPTWTKSPSNANMSCPLFGAIPPCVSSATMSRILIVQSLQTRFFALTHPLGFSCSLPSRKVLVPLQHIGCLSTSHFSDPPPMKTDVSSLGILESVLPHQRTTARFVSWHSTSCR